MENENDDLIRLNDLEYDFEGYFKRHDEGTLSEQESDEFCARAIGWWVRDTYAGKSPPEWIGLYIADQFYKILAGGNWADEFPLPWTEGSQTQWLTPKGTRALEIYVGIQSAANDSPASNVTDLIYEQAKKYSVSYETARADYYTMKKAIDSKSGMPEKFLNPSNDF